MGEHPTPPKGPRNRTPRDAEFWAQGRNVLRVADVPKGAVNLNVEGRRVIGALQGFGQLWQKPYKVRLEGADVTPEEAVALWKREFPDFHPPESRFYPSLEGVAPGEIMLINASVQGMPLYTGVMVLYSDDVSFTVMTAEGLPEAGWNTFSAHDEDGTTVVQIQSLARERSDLRGRFPPVRLYGAGEDLDPRPLQPGGPLRGARSSNAGERVRGSESAMVSGREPLAQRGPQIGPLCHGCPGPHCERIASPPELGV